MKDRMSKETLLRNFMEEVWNGQGFDRVGHFVHPEYTIHLDTADPWEGQTLDHAEFQKRLRFSFDSFPDMHFEITSAIEDEGHVAITWILTGTNTGKIGDFPPTGKSIRTNGMTIYHFREGLISGHTQVFDRQTVMRQLGFA